MRLMHAEKYNQSNLLIVRLKVHKKNTVQSDLYISRDFDFKNVSKQLIRTELENSIAYT